MHLYVGLIVVGFGLLLIGCSVTDRSPGDAQNASAEPPALQERTELIPPGAPAPDFELADQTGAAFRLADCRGRPVVLVFYPKDFTPVCTKQLCTIRNDWEQFRTRGVVVVGVNPGTAEDHRRFVERYELPFRILVDAQQRVAAAYGCKGAGGTPQRTVYAINAKGVVVFAERGMPATTRVLTAVDGR